MTKTQKFLTRFLAAAAMVALYCVSTLGVTTVVSGVALTATTTAAEAQWRGRGRGRGRGWRGRGRGIWIAPLVVPPRWCHRPYSSRMYRCW